MTSVLIFDTSVATENLGDEIIVESVREQLRLLFPQAHFLNTSTHEVIGWHSFQLHRNADHTFVAGTNLLNAHMFGYRRAGQWRLNLLDALKLSNLTLMGVGWNSYQSWPTGTRTQWLLRRMLHKDALHSVRDQYTLEKLQAAGIPNAVNTGCPTTWSLTPSLCAEIPPEKSDTVVFTLTYHHPDRSLDKAFVELLAKHYQHRYFWPQGVNDRSYIKSLGVTGFELLPPSLAAYDSLLRESPAVDYVGNRLHAGIRALRARRRSIILSIDNRAAEIRKDINLPVVPRDDLQALTGKITSAWNTGIRIDQSAIAQWKRQFAACDHPQSRLPAK